MKHRITVFLVIGFAATILSACSEQPQRVVSERDGYNVENGVSPLHERTLTQGESRRLAY
jgi:hypothetical protein